VTSGNNENVESEESKEFIGLKEFFSIVVKIAGTLAGFAGLFILFGYTIILSFINNIGLYGLASFPQEFYKEATMKFVGDMFESYGNYSRSTIALFIVIAGIVFVSVKYRHAFSEKISARITHFVSLPLILLITLITLRLEILPERLFSITGIKKFFIFMISVPVLSIIFLYIAFKFRQFMKRPYRFYYFMLLLFLGLFISIPVGYGDHVFDLEIFPVVGIDYADGTNIESLKKLREDINTQGKGSLFFLMGHAVDREIFLDNQSFMPPAKIILVERNLIKFLHISMENTIPLRNILKKQEGIVPVQGYKAGIVIDELPEDIKRFLEEKR
jgi:hypothetical protein